MMDVDLNKAPTDILIAALAHGREPEVYTERNGGRINRPDFTDYLVQITKGNLSSVTKLILSSGHMPAYVAAAQETPNEALKIIAARINKKEVRGPHADHAFRVYHFDRFPYTVVYEE